MSQGTVLMQRYFDAVNRHDQVYDPHAGRRTARERWSRC
jgi:hypothetical protein